MKRDPLHLVVLAASVACVVPAVEARAGWPKPEPAPTAAPIAPPRDVPYRAPITLRVDATDVARRVYRIRERIPVDAGPTTLLFPQWMPGDHAPSAVVDPLASLVVTANGTRVRWSRDPVQVFAFHIDPPPGTTVLDVTYAYLEPSDARMGPVLFTSSVLDLRWQSVVLYPSTSYARDIVYEPQLVVPHAWNVVSALDGATRVGDVVTFAPTTLDVLVDSPVMAARYLTTIALATDPVPVRLDLAGDDAADLVPPPDAVRGFRNLVVQADRLVGARHYDHYDLMLWLSNDFGPSYYEHHRSGENAAPADYFRTWNEPTADHAAPVHGFVHTWNGTFRRPAEMWTPNFNTPERDGMMWVFEGLTDYWQDVLAARSGLVGTGDTLEAFADLAARVATRPGADWRPLSDVVNDTIVQNRKTLAWPSWQRDVFDAYDEGELIWLDVDARIRARTGGTKSLDDFARAFFGVRDGDFGEDTYTLEDLVAALHAIVPDDWAAFFAARLDLDAADTRIEGIARAGYRLTYAATPRASSADLAYADLTYSLGAIVIKSGRIADVRWGGPAFAAGVRPGGTVATIDGAPFALATLNAAIDRARDGAPIALTVRYGGAGPQPFAVAWHGGRRYPRLERVGAGPALLDAILAPRTS